MTTRKQRRDDRLSRDDVRFEVARSAKSRYDVLRDKGAKIKDSEAAMVGKMGDGGALLQRELFGRLYHPNCKPIDKPAETAVERVADVVNGELAKSSDWHKLLSATKYNPISAAVAAVEFAEWIVNDIDLPDPPPPSSPKGGDKRAAARKKHNDAQRDKGLEQWCDGVESDRGKAASMRGSLKSRAASAASAAREVADVMSGALGIGDAEDFAAKDPSTAMQLASELSRNQRVRELLKYLGAFMHAFSSSKRERTDGRVEPWSVTTGDDLRSLLPVERMRLAVPNRAVKVHTANRLMNRETLCLQLRSTNPSMQGPFRIMLDASGSMSGHRIIQATAFATAALLSASDEGRDVALTIFTGSAFEVEVDFSSPSARLETMNRVLGIGASGGTNIRAAFEHVAAIKAKGNAADERGDLLLLSDGQVSGDAHTIQTAKAVLDDTDLHYIVIGNEWAVTPWLRDVAKSCVIASDLSPDNNELTAQIAAATSA